MSTDITKHSEKRTDLIVALLLGIFIFTAVSTSLRTSAVCDAVAHHVPAGYSYLKTMDFRMNPAQPPLIRSIMAFPLVFMDLRLPTDHISWETNDSPVFGQLFFFEYNGNAGDIIFWSRIPMILLGALLGFIVFKWASRVYGNRAGLLALFLYSFSPAVIGNSSVAMTDIGASFFIFLAVYRYWYFLKKKEKRFFDVIIPGICLGLAQASKITAVVLYPLFIALALPLFFGKNCYGSKIRLSYIFGMFFIGVLALWACYGFEFKPLLQDVRAVDEKIDFIRNFSSMIPLWDSAAFAERSIYFAKNIPIPLSTYIMTFSGIANQVITGGQRVFFFGEAYPTGVRSYYLVNFLIKTPLTMVIFVFSGIFLSILRKRTKKDPITEMSVFLPIVIFFTIASFSRLQGAVRYILPAYPFLFVWVSDLANLKLAGKARGLFLRATMMFLMAWYVLTSVSVFPHYLAYFNEILGGVHGWGYMISHDSDWGQDLPALAEYMRNNGVGKIRFSYFGEDRPERHGIVYQEIGSEDKIWPQKGEVYAISVRWLKNFAWTKKYAPTKNIGGTILVYDLRIEA